jgi:hypothetical protein
VREKEKGNNIMQLRKERFLSFNAVHANQYMKTTQKYKAIYSRTKLENAENEKLSENKACDKNN